MNSFKVTDCSAAILAGGKNSRYGGFHKAFLRIDDKLIIQHHLDLLANIFDDIIIISNEIDLFQQFGVKVFPDIYENRGPIAGLHSALKNSEKGAVMVFGCDMPYLEESLIYDLYSSWKSGKGLFYVPRSDEHLEPLHALYSKESLSIFSNWLETHEENAIYKFLAEQDLNFIEIGSKRSMLVNINSPEDFSKIDNH
jgi:molybdenum cofactor guanylyltransferase